MAQGAAETNLAGVFLAKSPTDAEGFFFPPLPVYCSDLSRRFSVFPSLQTAPYLVLTVQLPVKRPLIHLGEQRTPFVSCSGVTK